MSDLEIQKLVAGGDGLAFVDGKAIFVPGVLPGERVRVHVVTRRRDYDRAAVEAVITASPARVKPPCRLAGICGGCDWLHIDPEEQRRQKLAILREALRRTGHVDPADLSIDQGPVLGLPKPGPAPSIPERPSGLHGRGERPSGRSGGVPRGRPGHQRSVRREG